MGEDKRKRERSNKKKEKKGGTKKKREGEGKEDEAHPNWNFWLRHCVWSHIPYMAGSCKIGSHSLTRNKSKAWYQDLVQLVNVRCTSCCLWQIEVVELVLMSNCHCQKAGRSPNCRPIKQKCSESDVAWRPVQMTWEEIAVTETAQQQLLQLNDRLLFNSAISQSPAVRTITPFGHLHVNTNCTAPSSITLVASI